MKLDKKMCKVVADLEYCIASQCFNQNSYNPVKRCYGRFFRYPINFPVHDERYTKIHSNINEAFYIEDEAITPDAINGMIYKFGGNELLIGKGLIEVLNYLEERYGIDFNELESHK